jgi:hypothetical protein
MGASKPEIGCSSMCRLRSDPVALSVIDGDLVAVGEQGHADEAPGLVIGADDERHVVVLAALQVDEEQRGAVTASDRSSVASMPCAAAWRTAASSVICRLTATRM